MNDREEAELREQADGFFDNMDRDEMEDWFEGDDQFGSSKVNIKGGLPPTNKELYFRQNSCFIYATINFIHF